MNCFVRSQLSLSPVFSPQSMCFSLGLAPMHLTKTSVSTQKGRKMYMIMLSYTFYMLETLEFS